MASTILKACTTWVGGYDLTGDTNQTALDLDHEVHDVTVFQPVGSGGARQRLCGLEDVSMQDSGMWATGVGSVDENAFSRWGLLDEPITKSSDGVEGSVGYMLRGGRFNYSLFGQHGQPAPFSLGFKGSNGETAVARGLVTKGKAVVSGTGATGTSVQLGAVGATQFLYIALHAFTAGTTVTVQVQHATDSIFTTPLTVGSVPAVTAVGGSWARFAGAFAGPWFRINVTAITGSFTLAATVGTR